MGFLIPCPNCGPRDVYEFKFGGECKNTPAANASLRELRHYFYFNRNVAGEHEESWYHDACESWLLIRRNTLSNTVIASRRLLEDL